MDLSSVSCTSYYEGTELKANHNRAELFDERIVGCTSYYEGTELKANHNTTASGVVETALY